MGSVTKGDGAPARSTVLFAFAGIWDRWKDPSGDWVNTYSILTTTPNAVSSAVHDGMPVILDPDGYLFGCKALPKPDFHPPTSAEAVPPRDELEARLVKIWQEILQTESIGVSDATPLGAP